MKRTLLISIFLLACFFSHAQRRLSIPFSSTYDENAPIVLGINYSYINSKYIVHLNQNWNATGIDFGPGHVLNMPDLKSINSAPSHGMSVGIPVDFRITDNWYGSFHPSFVFINNTAITYTDMDPERQPLDRRLRHIGGQVDGSNFNSFEFPFRIRLRSDEKYFLNRENRYRGYITGGAKLTRWIGIMDEYSKLKSSPIRTNAIIMKPEYVSWEIGVGAEIFFTYFKMSPEIRFSQSFGDILAHNHELSHGNLFMGKLDKVFARGVYLSLIFQ